MSIGNNASVDAASTARTAAAGKTVGLQGTPAVRRAAWARLVNEASVSGSAATGMSVVRGSGRTAMAGFVGSSSRGSAAGGKSRSESRFVYGGGPALSPSGDFAASRLRCFLRSPIADNEDAPRKILVAGKN
jgi:hypothetical protein